MKGTIETIKRTDYGYELTIFIRDPPQNEINTGIPENAIWSYDHNGWRDKVKNELLYKLDNIIKKQKQIEIKLLHLGKIDIYQDDEV